MVYNLHAMISLTALPRFRSSKYVIFKVLGRSSSFEYFSYNISDFIPVHALNIQCHHLNFSASHGVIFY